ncbi:MAG TPA: glycosyltransferase family 9 protein [Candidatus Binatia bacterium]|nr:glycosyltransferase family 9 protein [Candidatus Binatia bacterium]
MKKLAALFRRHVTALWYVLTVVLPVILRTGRRPVIFSKYSGIGDIICTFPAVLKLKENHPGATFLYNCHRPYACLPVMAGVTDRVTHLRHTGVLRYWHGWLFAAFYEFPCADERVDDCCKDYVVMEYASDHNVTVSAAHPHLDIASAVRNRVNERLKPLLSSGASLVVIQTGPSWPIREWPERAWSELVAGLRKKSGVTMVQIGTDHHLAMGNANVPAMTGVVSLVNQLTLEESCAVIAASRLFVGIDSGLLHVAASLRVPCVGIFGPTSPQFRLPPEDVKNCAVSRIQCQGCHHRVPRIHWEKNCPYDIACMKGIPVQEVLETCMRLLPRN